ncbi:winged helix DNA-binding domain-containing protein [Dactylosporangium sp. CS-047395]|uniref:winged helix DNA-binding domain-containing protein n=1 Tax=Dactylosporangium sp. CS-047395 TaxID=3239936 RepID=UPI003D8D4DF0
MTVGARRLRAQLLSGPPVDSVLGAVERVVGVQAQSWPAARLAVRARTRDLTAADVDRALARGELARTWLMRGTLHLVAAADLGWLTELFGPLNGAAGERRREELGVDAATAAQALAELPGILSGAGPMDRGELVARLARRGVRIDASGQAPAHLIAYAASTGLVCRGPDLSGRPTVILTADIHAASRASSDRGSGRASPSDCDSRFAGSDRGSGRPSPSDCDSRFTGSDRGSGRPLSPDCGRRFTGDAALAELARRYLLGYGPADASDFAAWSGLPMASAHRALALCPDTASLSAAVPPPRLLGQFDSILLGYRDRSFVLPAVHARRVNTGGGMIAPTLLIDGQVAGLWRRAGRRVVLRPFPGARLPGGARAALEAEVADMSRFLGERLTPAWEDV